MTAESFATEALPPLSLDWKAIFEAIRLMQTVPRKQLKTALFVFTVLVNEVSSQIAFRANETQTAHFEPAIAADSMGNFIVVWTDGRHTRVAGGNEDGTAIYGMKFSFDGTPLGQNFRVSESVLGGSHWAPSVSMNIHGDFLIAWQGKKNDAIWGHSDIYARRFQRNGTPMGPTFKVNDDTTIQGQLEPKVFLSDNGRFFISWYDRREGPLFYYAQFYDSTGLAIGRNVRINTNDVAGVARAGIFPDGRAFFYWASGYFQLYDHNGQTISELRYTGIDGNLFAFGNDTLLILWTPLPREPLYGRFYHSNGSPLSPIFQVSDDTVRALRGKSDVARFANGTFAVVWQDHRNDFPGTVGNGDVYAQRFDKRWNPIGPNFKVNHEPWERRQRNPAVAVNKDQFVTVWLGDSEANRSLPIILAPDVLILKGENIAGIIQSFLDPVPGKVFGWQTITTSRPEALVLHQNFPNPFNAATKIWFDLPERSYVDLSVYNLLGQRVRQLVDWELPPGEYEAWLSSESLPSGVYIYRLRTPKHAASKRMTIVR